MPFSYGDNSQKVIDALLNKDRKALQAGKTGLQLGLRMYESEFQRGQLSGRTGADMGLNTRSGELKRSWFIRTGGSDLDFFGVLASRSKYAAIHQFGGTIVPKTKKALAFKIGDKVIVAKSVKMPKRLTILEDFKKSGRKMVKQEIQDALIAAYKK